MMLKNIIFTATDTTFLVKFAFEKCPNLPHRGGVKIRTPCENKRDVYIELSSSKTLDIFHLDYLSRVLFATLLMHFNLYHISLF